MDADENGSTIRYETELGNRPIHAALANKAPSDLIQMLLEADSQLSGDEPDADSDIFAYYKGLLPIQMACLNGASTATVSLLLDKDVNNLTLLQKYNGALREEENAHDDVVSTRPYTFQTLRQSISLGSLKQKIALHFAISHSSDEVIRLFLHCGRITEDDRIISHLDKKGRCALHLACYVNAPTDIICGLLNLDTNKHTIHLRDNLGMRPIQYACCHQDARKEVVEHLLNAERKYKTMHRNKRVSESDPQSDRGSRTTPSQSGRQSGPGSRPPLWHAVTAGASAEVLTVLMGEESFSLKRFDSKAAKRDLSNMIKDHLPMQRSLNRKLSDRAHFSRLTLRLSINVLALILFYFTTESLAKGTVTDQQISYLWFCSVSFVATEFFQMVSQSLRVYILEIWNFYEITNISFLIASTWILAENKDTCSSVPCALPERSKHIMAITAVLLVFNVIFFLRSVFLPFALFATGLVNILITLIPFFCVSVLMLLAFTELYRLGTNFGIGNFDIAEGSAHYMCADPNSFQDCFLVVLQGKCTRFRWR